MPDGVAEVTLYDRPHRQWSRSLATVCAALFCAFDTVRRDRWSELSAVNACRWGQRVTDDPKVTERLSVIGLPGARGQSPRSGWLRVRGAVSAPSDDLGNFPD